MIDTLESPDDGRPQAEAIARDYLANLDDAQLERGGSRPRPYLSTEDVMPTATAARVPDRASSQRERLRCRIRLADGRVFAGELAPERHRALQLGMLHEHTAGLVELAAGRQARRPAADHHPPARRSLPRPAAPAAGGWLEELLELAERHAARGEEVFVAPAVRSAPRGEKQAVSETRYAVGRRRPARAAAPRCGRSSPSARATC